MKHLECFIQPVEILGFLHSKVGLILSSHGYSVETFRPQLDQHFGLPLKIVEWIEKIGVILLYLLLHTKWQRTLEQPAMQTLKFSGGDPR